MNRNLVFCSLLTILVFSGIAYASDEVEVDPKVDIDIGSSREGSRTDDEVVQREEESIKLDGLNVAQMKHMREKAEKHTFQAEVDRMMKLIINSLYKNKEIFLRELISNASDALDKVRFLSLTDDTVMDSLDELSIKIKADKDNHMLHITDTGIGMTKGDLINNLGTIAKSGTSEFLNKMGEAANQQQMSDMIGQFGVGFYSTFLVADKVIVTTKHNDDDQYIWESDAQSFSIIKDPRGNTLKRGTTISLHLKEEAQDFLDNRTIKDLVTKYSQFINFEIYLWESRVEKVEEKEETITESEEDGIVEDVDEEKKTKVVDKTVWEWKLLNNNKPIWSRKPSEIEDKEYADFYRSFTKDYSDPLTYNHFVAEGEVTFRSILFIPKSSPEDQFQGYGKRMDQIKMFVRRVFITDNFENMMPKYLQFVKGVVDSDDLPLNVSRETLQQHKLLKVIKKKLIRKTIDMIKKLTEDDFDTFWKEYSTNIKLGVIEDSSNRTRLSKLLKFESSHSKKVKTSLTEYIERMKDNQDSIFYIGGSSRDEVEKSPFVERLLKKGYEILYLTEPVDEYCIQSLPEYEGKKFQNIAKEGLKLNESEKAKEMMEAEAKEFESLTNWLKENALKDKIEKAIVSERLTNSPCALVASSYGWSGNMERLMKAQTYQKSNDATRQIYGNQRKTLEINPRHPIIRELKNRIEEDEEDQTNKDLAVLLFDTATLRSGFSLQDTFDFAHRIENVLKLSMDISLDEKVEDFQGDNENDEEILDETTINEDEDSNAEINDEKPTRIEL